MLSSPYYRRQADICLGMALAAQDENAAEEFRSLALAFLAKANEAEGQGAPVNVPQDQSGGTEIEVSRD